MKRIGLIFLVMALVIGSILPAFATNKGNDIKFRDIPETYWANDAIKALVSEGILSGYSDGTFGPDKSITREEFAVILVNTFDIKISNSGTELFKDVPTTRWSYPYIDASKDYLTGYFYKNGGKPAFDPAGAAMREDVAVALVKAMGLEDTPIDGEEYLEDRFKDVESISPKLRDQVAIAVKYKLMGGFPNKTFKGNAVINRASVAQLFYNAMKSPYFKDETELNLYVKMDDKTNVPKVSYSGTVSAGASLTMNDTAIATNNGAFSGTVTLDKGYGSYNFSFKAVRTDGSVKIVNKTVVYEVKAPVITLNNLPTTTSNENLQIKGKVNKADGTYPRVFINDSEVAVSSDGSFNTIIKLIQGENVINVKAINTTNGATSVVTKKVSFAVSVPTITFYDAPETSTTVNATFTGIIGSKTDRYPKLYVNDTIVSLNYYNEFRINVTLKEGVNTYVFKVIDSLGRSTTVTKTINYLSNAPEIKVTSATESNKPTYQLKGTLVDKSYPVTQDTLTINGKKITVASNGEWTHDVVLVVGKNLFSVEAVNASGKVAKVSFVVDFVPAAPVVNINDLPASTDKNTLVVYGNVSDINDPAPKIFVNGTEVVVTSSGVWSSGNISPVGTEYKITVVGKNSYGKTTTVEKVVKYEAPAPAPAPVPAPTPAPTTPTTP